MNDESTRKLDKLTDALAPEIQPRRDLWPRIKTRLRQNEGRDVPAWRTLVARGLAAAILVVASSLTTFFIMQRDTSSGGQQHSGGLDSVPTRLAGDAGLGAKYRLARESLIDDLDRRLTELPDDTRRTVIANLQVINSALQEINSALEAHPNNTLLQQLLVTTYLEELDVLAEINQMTSTRTET